jgi:tetratricopeptide (TPR) repeat protein
MVASSMVDENNLEPKSTDDLAPVSGEPSAAGSTSLKDLTPGQRLAAKKAVKAEHKREVKDEAKRKAEEAREKEEAEANRTFGRVPDAPQTPDNVQRAAVEFSSYLQGHRAALLGLVVGVVGIGLAWIYGKQAIAAGSVEQTQLLAVAAELANSGIDPADADRKTDDGKAVYPTVDARDRAAIDAYVRAASEDAKSLAGGWARLAEAALAMRLERYADAAKTFEAVYASHKEDDAMASRALEGLSLALEAAGSRADAERRLEELKGLDHGFSGRLAEYHLARIKLAAGDRDGAKASLKALYDSLVEATGKGERSPFLRGEVEVRLAELDSSLVHGGGMGAGAEPGQLSPAEIQRLIEQMQKQQSGASGSRGAE